MDEPIRYGTLEASPHRTGEFFADGVRGIRELVDDSPFAGIEIHWTEWNAQHALDRESVTFADNRSVDSLYGGAFVARSCIELDEACESLAYWSATDIFEEHPIPGAPFSCTYGLVTIHGVPKATANAFRLMAKLDGPRCELELSEAPWGCGAVAVEQGRSLRVLCYNHLFVSMPERPPWDVTLARAGSLAAGEYIATLRRVREGAGSARETWEAIGSPNTLTPSQLDALRRAAEPDAQMMLVRVSEDGTVTRGKESLSVQLASHELCLLALTPCDVAAPPKSKTSNLAKFEGDLGEAPG
jgi:xylan 1,4-beta-xylosidase